MVYFRDCPGDWIGAARRYTRIVAESKPFWNPNAAVTPRRKPARMSYFTWLEGSARPEFKPIRTLIAELFDEVNPKNPTRMLERLRSERHSDFFSAYSEMAYFKALSLAGISVNWAGTSASGSVPDLRAVTPDGAEYFIECAIKMPPDSVAEKEAREHEFFEAVWEAMPDKSLRLDSCSVESPPGVAGPVAEFVQWLNDLSNRFPKSRDTSVAEDLGEHEFHHAESGWRIKFQFRRRRIPNIESSFLVGAGSWEMKFTNGPERLAAVLGKKQRQHSRAELPVIVAIGWNFFEDEPDVVEVVEEVSSLAHDFDVHGVCGVLWGGGIYPWSTQPFQPRFLHWNGPAARPFVEAWPWTTAVV